MSSCSIYLNSGPTGCFYAGDIVTGNVILQLERKRAFKRIALLIIGTCKAQWTRAAPTVPYIKIYNDKKKVLSISINDVFREKIVGQYIPAGVHQYPFHFALPADLPSTFEDSIAKITYFIKFVATPALPTCKISEIITFNVIGNVHVNDREELVKPISYTVQKTFRNSSKMAVNIETYQAFAPKQTIPIKISINNERKVKISKICFKLVQRLHYSVPSGYTNEEKTVCKVEQKKFSCDTLERCNLSMEIPHLVPTSLHTTDAMVEISYCLRVEVKFPFHLNIIEDIPVTVTSVPVIHRNFVTK